MKIYNIYLYKKIRIMNHDHQKKNPLFQTSSKISPQNQNKQYLSIDSWPIKPWAQTKMDKEGWKSKAHALSKRRWGSYIAMSQDQWRGMKGTFLEMAKSLLGYSMLVERSMCWMVRCSLGGWIVACCGFVLWVLEPLLCIYFQEATQS